MQRISEHNNSKVNNSSLLYVRKQLMKNIFIISHIIVILLVSSCQEEKKYTQQTQVINIPQETSDASVFLNEFELESIVPLETTPESAFRMIRRMIVREDYILISDVHHVYQFDRTGKFLGRIGRPGNGPGEYNHILDVCIDEKQKMIVINTDGPKLLYYSETGQFIRQEQMKERASFLGLIIVDSIQYFYNTFYSNYDNVIYKRQGKTMTSCGDLKVDKDKFIQYGLLFVKGKSILFTKNHTNIIYELKDGIVYERLRLNIDNFKNDNKANKKYTKNDSEELFKKQITTSFTSIRETNDGIFLRTNLGVFIWIKPNGDAYKFHLIRIPGITDCASYVAHSGDDDLIAFKADAEFILQRKKNAKNEKIESILQTVTEDDNPVLLFFRRKKG